MTEKQHYFSHSPHRYRHKKRGTTYQILMDGVLREHDLEPVIIYRAEKDGTVWVRPKKEFHDGRFEPLGPWPDGLDAESERSRGRGERIEDYRNRHECGLEQARAQIDMADLLRDIDECASVESAKQILRRVVRKLYGAAKA